MFDCFIVCMIHQVRVAMVNVFVDGWLDVMMCCHGNWLWCHYGCQGDALTQQPPIADWSAAVAEEEQHEGYYTDSMLGNRRYGNKRGNYGGGRYQRKSSLSGSYRDLGEFLYTVCVVWDMPCTHEWGITETLILLPAKVSIACIGWCFKWPACWVCYLVSTTL